MFPGSQNYHVQGRAVVSPQGRVIVVGAGESWSRCCTATND